MSEKLQFGNERHIAARDELRKVTRRQLHFEYAELMELHKKLREK